MALIWMDGFEQNLYNTAYSVENSMPARMFFTNQNVNNPLVRTVQPNGSAQVWPASNIHIYSVSVFARTTIFLGVAIYANSPLSNYKLITFNEQGNLIAQTKGIALELMTNGGLRAINLSNSSVYFTAPANTIQVGVWYYVEFGATFGASQSIELRVDNSTVATATNVDTRGGLTSTGYEYCSLFGALPSTYFDDLYIADNAGAINNNFLGPVNVYTLYPNGAGSSTQLTPDAGSNWQRVNQNTPDASHVRTSTTNLVDLYAVENLPITPSSIPGVIVHNVSLKNDNGTRKVRNKLKVGANTANGTTASLLYNTNRNTSEVYQLQPDGTSAWDATAVNNMEIGIESM